MAHAQLCAPCSCHSHTICVLLLPHQLSVPTFAGLCVCLARLSLWCIPAPERLIHLLKCARSGHSGVQRKTWSTRDSTDFLRRLLKSGCCLHQHWHQHWPACKSSHIGYTSLPGGHIHNTWPCAAVFTTRADTHFTITAVEPCLNLWYSLDFLKQQLMLEVIAVAASSPARYTITTGPQGMIIMEIMTSSHSMRHDHA